MPPIIANISSLPSDVMTIVNNSPEVFMNAMTEGMPAIKDVFTIIESDGKTPLWNIEMLDFLRPASQGWIPAEAIKLGAKIPTFQHIDGDLEFPREQILQLAETHVKHVAKAGDLKEVLQTKPFAYAFLDLLATGTAKLIEQNAAFKGVRSASPTAQGSALSIDGLNFRITEGVASGDIPTTNVFAATVATPTAASQYEEVLEIAQLTESQVALDGKPLVYHISPKNYRLYVQGRRAANPNIVSLSDKPDGVDDFENIKFKIVPGLAGSDKQFITVKQNLYFATPKGFVSAPVIDIVKDVKLWKVNIFTSGWFGYNYGRMLFTNDRN